MNRTAWLVAGMAIALAPQRARAATVTYPAWTARAVTSQEVADGAPADAKVLNFYVTTDADILSVGRVLAQTAGAFYEHQFPSNPVINPPFLNITADSWIRTPGPTAQLGAAFPGDGTDLTGWGDTQDNGPQTNFNFARLVVSPASAAWSFRGNVAVAGATGPEPFPFSFAVPEPTALSLCTGFLALAVARRRGGVSR